MQLGKRPHFLMVSQFGGRLGGKDSLVVNAGDGQFAIDDNLAQKIGGVLAGGLDIAFDPCFAAQRHGTQIAHGDGTADVARVQEALSGNGDECSRGQVVEDSGSGATV